MTFDLVMNVALKTLRIDGTLSFAVNRNTQLKVDTVVVNTSGKLFIGTEANPIQSQFTARILIADGGPIDRVWDPYMLSRGVISRGEVKMYGREVTPYVSLLVDPMYGSTTLSLAEVPVGWRVGDKLVIAGVDEMAPNGGAEERTILAINGTTVTIAALQMNHDAPNGYGVSIQVANLSRNIQLIAEDASVIAERPHLMFMHNPNVSVQNVGIYGFGRTDKSQPINDPVVVNGVLLPGTGTNPRARYAMHFHHTGVNPANAAVEVSGNVVVGSPGWGYVNHSSNVDFDSNVAYGVYGASFASEDGNEIGSMRYNLSISSLGMFDGVEVRADIHDFGFQGHGFWLQGPGVDVIGNIASGSRGGAFTIYTSSTKNLFDAVNLKDQSLAGGREAVPVGSVPFGAFAGNVAYGANTGVDIWRNLQVMNDRMSVVDGFFGWNISNVGIDIHYNGAVRVRNSVVLGDLQRYMGIGIRANFLTTGIVIENTELLGLELGVKAPVRQRTIIQGGAIAAVTGIEVEKGHAANRTVDISGVRFTTLSAAALNGRVQRNIYLFGPYDFMLAPARRVESLYSEDVVHYTPLGGEEVRLYYEEQLPSFVPFTQQNAAGYVPSLWMNLTNQQLQTLFGIRLRGGMAPASAMRIPGVFGGVGEAT